MYHIFFNHSSDNRHLGFLHVLAIINSAAMNIGVHVSFLLEFSTDIYLGRELLDHMVALFSGFFFFFKESPTVFHRGCINLHFHQ